MSSGGTDISCRHHREMWPKLWCSVISWEAIVMMHSLSLGSGQQILSYISVIILTSCLTRIFLCNEMLSNRWTARAIWGPFISLQKYPGANRPSERGWDDRCRVTMATSTSTFGGGCPSKMEAVCLRVGQIRLDSRSEMRNGEMAVVGWYVRFCQHPQTWLMIESLESSVSLCKHRH